VSADGAVFAATARFSRATFGRASLRRVRWLGDVSFSAAVFTDLVTFAGSEFVGVYFDDARFAGHASFRTVRFAGDAVFADATFLEGANFEAAVLSDRASLAGARVTGQHHRYERAWPDGWSLRPLPDGGGELVITADEVVREPPPA
jgi:uncharacterized protein YjbI with pentapeptide repeats